MLAPGRLIPEPGEARIPAVEMVGVSKTYRGRGGQPLKALDGLDMVVESGGVHGLLGPNGSGKTTSIRALLGLVGIDGGAGEMRLLDEPVRALRPPRVHRARGRARGAPLFFPGFSGRRNLRLLAETAGVPRGRVEECLETVALRERADDRFRGYSLGMKQRLGIAAALLKALRLLILDEPSNGLDPADIRDVRELIRRLGTDSRTTVLVSSHLLAEIQQVCDSVTILARGRRVATGPVSSVLAQAGAADIRVAVPDPAAAAAVLSGAGFSVSPAPDGQILVHGAPAPGDITRLLAGHGHYVEELVRVTPDLESAFLALTGEQA